MINLSSSVCMSSKKSLLLFVMMTLVKTSELTRTIVDSDTFNALWAAQQCQLATSCHRLQNAVLSTRWHQQRKSRVSSHFLNFIALFIFAFLSTQCISNIWQIIKSVCVSVWVSESLSESVTENELNALQIIIFHRSSPNLPPK